MKCTVGITQLKRKRKSDGTIPLYIRITENKQTRYLSTGLAIEPKYWNSRKQEVRGTHPLCDLYNQELKERLFEIEQKKIELNKDGNLTVSKLKESAAYHDSELLISQAKKYHESLEGTERFHEWKKFGVLLNNLTDFIGTRRVKVAMIDAEFIEEFQDYLLTRVTVDKDGNPKGNGNNTVRRKLTSLKGFTNSLIKSKELGIDPFLKVEKVSEAAVEKTKLTFEQIEAIRKLDLTVGTNLWHVRNYFLFSFFNAGIRFGDLCMLKWKNIIDQRLVYVMSKTNQQKSIKIVPQVNQILNCYRPDDIDENDYIFPLLKKQYESPFELRRKISSLNVMTNKRLKVIAKMANIQATVSFHVSRHSFAQHALKNGLDLYDISKALGHSSLTVTEGYLKSFDEEKLDKSMAVLFS